MNKIARMKTGLAAMDLGMKNMSAIITIKNKPFKVLENDLIYTPRIKSLKLGDLLEFNQVSEISSRDFILQGQPHISPDYYSIKGVVIEHPKSPPITTIRSGRKVQKKKVLGNYCAYTCILIKEITVNVNEEPSPVALKLEKPNPF